MVPVTSPQGSLTHTSAPLRSNIPRKRPNTSSGKQRLTQSNITFLKKLGLSVK